MASGFMSYSGELAGALVGWFVVLPLAAVGGYYAGRAADRKVTKITVAPEEVQP